MTQIIRFPGARRVFQKTGTDRLFVVGVDDWHVVPAEPVRMDEDLSIQYVPEDEVIRAGIQPDFWIERPQTTDLDRSVILVTLADDVLEQDDDGRLWLNGDEFGSGFLVDCGVAEPGDTPLTVGQPAAFLCMRRQGTACTMTVSVLGPVFWIFVVPTKLSPRPVLQGWRTVARELWQGRNA